MSGFDNEGELSMTGLFSIRELVWPMTGGLGSRVVWKGVKQLLNKHDLQYSHPYCSLMRQNY